MLHNILLQQMKMKTRMSFQSHHHCLIHNQQEEYLVASEHLQHLVALEHLQLVHLVLLLEALVLLQEALVLLITLLEIH